MEKKLNQLQAKIEADQNLLEKLFALESPEEVQSFLQAEGLKFELEEIKLLKEVLIKVVAKGESAELSDEDLEEVAGGIAITTSGIIATAAVVSATAAVVSATCVAGGFVHNVTRGRW